MAEFFAALLSLEPLDVLDCTSTNEAWRRSPLNIGSVKPTDCATICCAQTRGHRQTATWTDRQANSQTGGQTDARRVGRTGGGAATHTDRQRTRQTDRSPGTETDGQTLRLRDMQPRAVACSAAKEGKVSHRAPPRLLVTGQRWAAAGGSWGTIAGRCRSDSGQHAVDGGRLWTRRPGCARVGSGCRQ